MGAQTPKAAPFTVRLVATRDLSPSVRHFAFERTDGAPCEFEPGQWHNLFADHQGTEIRRAYSIASAPDGTPRFDLVVTRVPGGPMSEILHSMPIGTEMRAVGPFGMFVRQASDPTPALFVGTGAGIAPLRSMIQAALAARSGAKLSLLFGVRREEDILYREEIEAWTRDAPNVTARVTLSRGEPGWAGLRGYVQSHLETAWKDLGEDGAHVFICGLEKMVKDVKARCRGELSIGRKQVHQEKFD